jgi:uncharacterized protein YfdQ (DUF2303 family)
MAIIIHALTDEGDFLVADNTTGNDALLAIAATKYDADITMENLDTGEARADRMLLRDYLALA